MENSLDMRVWRERLFFCLASTSLLGFVNHRLLAAGIGQKVYYLISQYRQTTSLGLSSEVHEDLVLDPRLVARVVLAHCGVPAGGEEGRP
eukprot:scaffold2507_cov257-Ochromonas_danica.AAC.22